MKLKDKQAIRDWELYRKNLVKATAIDSDESELDQIKRKEFLLSNVLAFAKYYFPHYCTSDFASFHKRFLKKAIESDTIYMTRAWARDHAKSVTAGVILPLYLMLTGKMKNMLLVSYNESNATELLTPIKMELESNQRLLNDYGKFQSISGWEAGKFTTKDGCSFRAIGTGQSPRGARNQEARPDFILCDDSDEDEMVRNPDRLSKAWDWMNGALFGCFSITGSKRFIVVGNIIAQDSLVVRAKEVSDDFEQINILDSGGQPSWKERFTLEECQYMINKMGYRLSQREYFNNPINEGKVFKKDWFVFKKLPPMNTYKYMVAYLDPGFKKTKTSDSKAWVLVALHDGKFHVRKVFCDVASVNEMVGWGYAIDKLLKEKSAIASLQMEQVFLQDLLYKDFSAAKAQYGYPLPLSGDTRKKPDKDARIEATSGYFERGDVFFDEAIEEDHHCKRLVEQYLAFEVGVRTRKDGPDAMEGAFHILMGMVTHNADMTIGKRQKVSKYKM